MILKFLFIFFIVMYLLFKVGGFLARMFLGNMVKQNRNHTYRRTQQTQRRQPTDGNVSIDYDPKKDQKSQNRGFKGGDYIDYEEVK